MKKKLSVIAVIILVLAICVSAWYHAVAHLDDAVSLAGVAQK